MLKRFLVAKLLGLLLVGTCWAQQTEIDKKVARLAHAIAATEGFNVKGSLPNRLHNPGDIRSRLKHAYEGQIGLYHGYVVFRGDQFGWQALYAQIRRVLDDDSAFYNREMTFAQIAKVYATSPNWPKTLCKILQINPHLTFDEWFGLAPRVSMTERRDDTLLWLFKGRRDDMPVLWSMLEMPPQVR
jgi:hypothetical protein